MHGGKQAVYGLRGDDGNEEIEEHHGPFTFIHRLKEVSKPEIKTIAMYCPLAAAILAPFSTLLDIPALSVSHGLVRVALCISSAFFCPQI
jgi:hypothetical protein